MGRYQPQHRLPSLQPARRRNKTTASLRTAQLPAVRRKRAVSINKPAQRHLSEIVGSSLQGEYHPEDNGISQSSVSQVPGGEIQLEVETDDDHAHSSGPHSEPRFSSSGYYSRRGWNGDRVKGQTSDKKPKKNLNPEIVGRRLAENIAAGFQPSRWDQRAAVCLTAILHRCLDVQDYRRAGRAFGILLRMGVADPALDVLGDDYWGVGAEILMRMDRPKLSYADIGEEDHRWREKTRPKKPVFRYRFDNSDAEREARRERERMKITRQKIEDDDCRLPFPTPGAWSTVKRHYEYLILHYTPLEHTEIEKGRSAPRNGGSEKKDGGKSHRRAEIKSKTKPGASSDSDPSSNSDAETDYRVSKTERNWARVVTFYHEMYGLWIAHVEDLHRIEVQDIGGGSEQDFLEAESNMEHREGSTPERLVGRPAAFEELEKVRERRFKRAMDVRKHLAGVTSTYPFSENPGLMKLRAMVELWLADLSVPVDKFRNVKLPPGFARQGASERGDHEKAETANSIDSRDEDLLGRNRVGIVSSDAETFSEDSEMSTDKGSGLGSVGGYTNEQRESHLTSAKVYLSKSAKLKRART